MTTPQKYAIGLLVILGLVAAGFALTRPGSPLAGGISQNITTTQSGVWWFTNTHYFGSQQQTSVDNKGNISTIGNIVQTAVTAVNTLLGTTIFNNVVFSALGYSSTFSTANGNTQNVSTTQFCSGTTILIPQSSTSTLTLTLPAASSTYATCGATVGSWAPLIIDNESSKNVVIATSTGGNGIVFFVASTTITNLGAPAYPPTIMASSSQIQFGLYTSSSALNYYTVNEQRL